MARQQIPFSLLFSSSQTTTERAGGFFVFCLVHPSPERGREAALSCRSPDPPTGGEGRRQKRMD